MNSRNRSDRTSARATRVAASSLLALSALSVGMGSTLAAGAGGSIWTTNDPCSNQAAQNTNEYTAGDTVYVRGDNFAETAAIEWTITGAPGGGSGDPNAVVAFGSSATDAVGGFCLEAYVVANDDWGVYSVDVTEGKTKKNDNFRVDAPTAPEPTPEPTPEATAEPTPEPTVEPTPEPTVEPTAEPTPEPTAEATADPTPEPTVEPTPEPTAEPTPEPTVEPTPEPTPEPTAEPTPEPTAEPTQEPTIEVIVVVPTDPPAEEAVVDPTDPPADPPAEETVVDPTDPPAATDDPSQAVLGAVSQGGDIELPATDAATVQTGIASILQVLGLAGLAGAAVLFAPIRRRKADATD